MSIKNILRQVGDYVRGLFGYRAVIEKPSEDKSLEDFMTYMDERCAPHGKVTKSNVSMSKYYDMTETLGCECVIRVSDHMPNNTSANIFITKPDNTEGFIVMLRATNIPLVYTYEETVAFVEQMLKRTNVKYTKPSPPKPKLTKTYDLTINDTSVQIPKVIKVTWRAKQQAFVNKTDVEMAVETENCQNFQIGDNWSTFCNRYLLVKYPWMICVDSDQRNKLQNLYCIQDIDISEKNGIVETLYKDGKFDTEHLKEEIKRLRLKANSASIGEPKVMDDVSWIETREGRINNIDEFKKHLYLDVRQYKFMSKEQQSKIMYLFRCSVPYKRCIDELNEELPEDFTTHTLKELCKNIYSKYNAHERS